MKGAEIFSKIVSANKKAGIIHITFISQGLFEMQLFLDSYDTVSVFVDQTLKIDHTRSLKLTRLYDIRETSKPILFDVTSSSSLHCPISCRAELLREFLKQEFIIKNVKQNDWIKMNFQDCRIRLCYSKKLLDTCFP